MELKKGQKDAIIRKVVAQLEAKNNKEINDLTEKSRKSFKLSKKEQKKILDKATEDRLMYYVSDMLKKKEIQRHPGYYQKVSDAIELSSLNAQDLDELLKNLSKQFNIDLK
jgi:hypothetical protein